MNRLRLQVRQRPSLGQFREGRYRRSDAMAISGLSINCRSGASTVKPSDFARVVDLWLRQARDVAEEPKGPT
jgi:hypothetical protein